MPDQPQAAAIDPSAVLTDPNQTRLTSMPA
jgi:hypothetical protein